MAKEWLKEIARKRAEEAAKKIIGTTFGYLTVLEVFPGGKVSCLCQCGNIREKPYNRCDIQQLKTTSCGCMRAKKMNETNRKPGGMWDRDWIGGRYSSLTIVKDLPDYMCEVLCDCGNTKIVFKGNLTKGDIKSCGCSSHELRSVTNLEKYGSKTVSCNVSKGEKELADILRSWGLTVERKDIPNGPDKVLELDIVIEEKKIAIEYNGARWHSTEFKEPRYHYNKMIAANEAGYRLIHIFDFEWKGRKNQVLSFLKSALGLNERKVPGRKTEIRSVPSSEALQFLKDYHILSSVPGQYLGCYLGEELLAVAVFRKHHVRNDGLTMARWCVKEGVTVQGGLSKVMKAIPKLLSFSEKEVFTWADRRHSEAKGYSSSGWELDDTLSPDYFYFDPKTKKVIYKNQRRKSVMKTPVGETEDAHAKRDGLYKIWDCGKVRFKYTIGQ